MWYTHGGETKPAIYYSINPNDVFNVENEAGSMHVFPHSLNHMVPPSESKQKRYTLGITIHGLEAIDKPLIQGAALVRKHRETIFLSGD